jgi:SpoVK/Ycf46/Vps4 family AAA+-type ATPase
MLGGNSKAITAALFRVATQLQPSVIFLADAERLFGKTKRGGSKGKGKGKGDGSGGGDAEGEVVEDPQGELDLSKIRRDLQRHLKLLKPEDRVLFIGTSSAPQDANKALATLFARHVFVGYPDYPARMKLWQHFIEQMGGVIAPPLSLSTLARISEGYSTGAIKQAIGAAASKGGSARDKKPVPYDEYISQLAKTTPTFKTDDEALRRWAAKLPVPEIEMALPDGTPVTKDKGKADATGKKKPAGRGK